MRRRELIVFAAAWPVAARAQSDATLVLGFLHSGAPEQNTERINEYFGGLAQAGFTEGKNLKVEYRWAMGHSDRLPALAAELVQSGVTAIATPGSTPAAIAAKKATSTIPIVFAIGADPVEVGLVASIGKPGGNATGVTSRNTELAAKRLGLIRELLPRAAHFAAIVNPTSQLAGPFTKDLEAGAATVGIKVEILGAATDAEIEAALTGVPKQPGNVVLFASDSFFYIRRAKIAALAMQLRIPSIFDVPEYVAAGGLMSYGSDFSDVLHVAGRYTGRILKGENPADLPVAQSAKFTLAINLQTAKALGVTAPPRILALADQVVE